VLLYHGICHHLEGLSNERSGLVYSLQLAAAILAYTFADQKISIFLYKSYKLSRILVCSVLVDYMVQP
jgi:hypothetical protein